MRDIAAIHPGEQLREEFMKPHGLTAERLADALGVATPSVAEVVAERGAVSSEMALRLARYFGTSARFWLDMQRDFDLERTAAELGDRINREVKNGPADSAYDGNDRRIRPRLG